MSGENAEKSPMQWLDPYTGTPPYSILALPALPPRTNSPREPSMPADTPGRVAVCLTTSGSPMTETTDDALSGVYMNELPDLKIGSVADTQELSMEYVRTGSVSLSGAISPPGNAAAGMQAAIRQADNM